MRPTEKLANYFGYELIKTKKHPNMTTHLNALIQERGIKTVIDVGANEGQFALRLRKAGFSGDIHSFEPTTLAFNNLQKNAEGDNKWFIYNTALGSEAKKQTINVYENSSALSSFLDSSDFGKSRMKEETIARKEEVSISTLSDFIDSELCNHKNGDILLKLDTQGFDLEVFKGATATLESFGIILTEISLKPIYEGMPSYLESLKTYNEAGFAVTGLYPVARVKDSHALVEVDCVLINENI